MERGRYSLAVAVTGMITMFVASMIIWLLLSEPVALATAVGDHDLSALAQAIGHALAEGLKEIVKYL
jgi:hypothetical protein